MKKAVAAGGEIDLFERLVAREAAVATKVASGLDEQIVAVGGEAGEVEALVVLGPQGDDVRAVSGLPEAQGGSIRREQPGAVRRLVEEGDLLLVQAGREQARRWRRRRGRLDGGGRRGRRFLEQLLVLGADREGDRKGGEQKEAERSTEGGHGIRAMGKSWP